jgi:hypothetical protein
MRFGLSDLDELPSLKEFEALAREALGADDGVDRNEVAPPSEQFAESAAPQPEPPESAGSGEGGSEPTDQPARQAARGSAR